MEKHYDFKDYSSRATTRFLKEVCYHDSRGKLESFCDVFDFDVSEVRDFIKLSFKYGNPLVIKEINKSKSITSNIRRWFELNESNLSFQRD